MATSEAIRTIRERLRGYTDKGLARLGLTVNAVEATRTAHVLAHHSPDGNVDVVLEYAAQLQAEAARVLEQAVVTARSEGRSWERIGDALGVSRQAAQERFKAAEAAWKDALIEPVVPDGRSITTMKGPLFDLGDPDAEAARVDADLLRITGAPFAAVTPNARPVAERLPQHDAATRVLEVTWRANEIARRRGVDGEVPADMVEDYQERKAAAVAAGEAAIGAADQADETGADQ